MMSKPTLTPSSYIAKSDAREQGRQYRLAMTGSDHQSKSQALQQNVIKALKQSMPRSIHIYQAITKQREVETAQIIKWLQSENVPHHLQSHGPVFPSNDLFDVVIMPALAVDTSGNRVGYGKGGYDRFLATQSKAQRLALVFDGQLVEGKIAHEPHDQPVNIVITESRQINF